MTNRLKNPVTAKEVHSWADEILEVSVASMQGYRETMEDRHKVMLKLPHHHEMALFAVFDGHGGSMASQWLAEHLAGVLDEQLTFTDAHIKEALLEADKQCCAGGEGSAGSTLCSVLLRRGRTDHRWPFIVINVGDSRCVIGREADKTGSQLTHDHKPTDPHEAERIREAGGYIQHNRVDGHLAMSRSMGDKDLKSDPKLEPEEQKARVTAVPDVKRYEMGEEDFIVIACDGVFERMTSRQVVVYVSQERKKGKPPLEVLKGLLDTSLARGSKDNMTAMLITRVFRRLSAELVADQIGIR